MSTLGAILPLFEAAHDAAEEGQKVITAMLIVGLVFLGVIALGELSHHVIQRRRSR